jgi:hypothetical protein
LIDHNRDLSLVTEFWPNGIKACGGDPVQYLELLEDCGFKIYCMQSEGFRLRRLANSEFKNMVQNRESVNLFCIKR